MNKIMLFAAASLVAALGIYVGERAADAQSCTAFQIACPVRYTTGTCCLPAPGGTTSRKACSGELNNCWNPNPTPCGAKTKRFLWYFCGLPTGTCGGNWCYGDCI